MTELKPCPMCVEAWNRRAELTCRNVEEETEESGFNELGFFKCSACGEYTKLDWSWHGDVDELRHCARCGAKVVEHAEA